MRIIEENDEVVLVSSDIDGVDINSEGDVIYDYEDGYYSVSFSGVTRSVRADDIELSDAADVDYSLIGTLVPEEGDKVLYVNSEIGNKSDPFPGYVVEDLGNGWYKVNLFITVMDIRADELELQNPSEEEVQRDAKLSKYLDAISAVRDIVIFLLMIVLVSSVLLGLLKLIIN